MTEQEPMADLHLTGFCVLPSGDVLLDLYAPGGMHHALVDYEGLREVADTCEARPGPVRGTRPPGSPVKNCTCDRALLPPSGGSLPMRTAQRDAVRCWCCLHLQRFPELWFRPVELARVIHQQYACEPYQSRSGFSGRLATVKCVLAELEEAGDVVRSDDGKRWRAT